MDYVNVRLFSKVTCIDDAIHSSHSLLYNTHTRTILRKPPIQISHQQPKKHRRKLLRCLPGNHGRNLLLHPHARLAHDFASEFDYLCCYFDSGRGYGSGEL